MAPPLDEPTIKVIITTYEEAKQKTKTSVSSGNYGFSFFFLFFKLTRPPVFSF